MKLTPEQTQSVASWVAAGDNLSVVQKKLADEFGISMTYMDVRFLVDDLDLTLKDAAPKADASDVTKAPAAKPAPAPAPEKKGFFDKAKERLGLGGDKGGAPDAGDEEALEELPPEDDYVEDAAAPAGAGAVRVEVDRMTLIPGAVASGTVTFSDGVTGKWIIDQYGRPGFTEVSQPGYRPSVADSQAFVQELSMALQARGY